MNKGLKYPFTECDFSEYYETLPLDIQYLALMGMASTPVNYASYKEIKNRYPIYWNSLGEFDPYFYRRNHFINTFKKIKRYLASSFLTTEELWVLRESPRMGGVWKLFSENYSHYYPFGQPSYADLYYGLGKRNPCIQSLLNKHLHGNSKTDSPGNGSSAETVRQKESYHTGSFNGF